jgi:Sensors of blue-light using FAD
MRQLLYVSNTDADAPAGMLDGILESSRRNNATHGVTGMLLALEGAFLQVLEGEPGAVEDTYRRIRTDPRHWDATTLIDQTVAARAFGQWSMGFQRLPPGPADVADAFRISRAAVSDQLAPGAPVQVVTLLETFQQVHGASRRAGA